MHPDFKCKLHASPHYATPHPHCSMLQGVTQQLHNKEPAARKFHELRNACVLASLSMHTVLVVMLAFETKACLALLGTAFLGNTLHNWCIVCCTCLLFFCTHPCAVLPCVVMLKPLAPGNVHACTQRALG